MAAAPTVVGQPSDARMHPVTLGKQVEALRRMAATDFLVDPDGHSIRWHYERADRIYTKIVAWRTFEGWSLKDDWTTRRTDYWENIENRVRQHMADDILRRRLEDLEKLERTLVGLEKYLEPLVDRKGEPLIDKKTGLPKFALELGSMDKFMNSYLKLHERVMLLRGEATSRTEQLRAPDVGDDAPLNGALQGPSRLVPKISRQDARAAARAMLMQREPALGGTPEDDKAVIDAVAEDAEDANHDSDEHEELHEGQAGRRDEGASDGSQ